MLHLRVIAPADCTDRAHAVLQEHPGVTNIVVVPGAGPWTSGSRAWPTGPRPTRPARAATRSCGRTLQARTKEESSLSGAYLVLFAVATSLAGIAVLLDSAILVIGQ